MNSTLFQQLNPQQIDICKSIEGANLILAGAGSGKTRVLTYRIAHLILDHQIPANAILAVTFTNKAAKEMRQRIEQLLGMPVDHLWIGTFHSIFARILRIEASYLNYHANFTIYDNDDSIQVVKKILKNLNRDVKEANPKSIFYSISAWKDNCIKAKQITHFDPNDAQSLANYVYYRYELELKENNAFDFNDLIVKSLTLFQENETVLKKYQEKFRFILVDEYQDTNLAQYELIRLLAQSHNRITVVGDEDQSIYAWRGAKIENILNFEKDFPNAKVHRLEQNYRSGDKIIQAANELVSHNTQRLGKRLWTQIKNGESIGLIENSSDSDEAFFVIRSLCDEQKKRKLSLNDFVILYRTNAQSRLFEDQCRQLNIAYRIIGGMKFYDRKEIKDILAYLRLLVNPNDAVAWRRIINFPARGIGEVSVDKISRFAEMKQLSISELCRQIRLVSDLSKTIMEKIHQFSTLMDELRSQISDLNAYQLLDLLLKQVPIVQLYQLDRSPDNESRIENIQEFIRSVQEYSANYPEKSMSQFLEEVQLLSDLDQWNQTSDSLTMMTLHAAKGLEFPIVYIVGLEEGILPHQNSLLTQNGLEEERRLFYVGITRAEKKLFLSWSKSKLFGSFQRYNIRSSFLDELPKNHLEKVDNSFISNSANVKKSQNTASKVDGGNHFLRRGAEVEHDVYGIGLIIDIQGAGAQAKLTIKFRSGDIKKFIAQYTKLKFIAYID